ncbi:MAG: thioether cross-link-forming SCIFF peptide maturase [Clostridia bacterium]|jgi:uncharacterized protein
MSLVHAFQSCGLYILLDVNSGAVYQVDKLVYEIIHQYKNLEEREIIQNLKQKYEERDIDEALAEIHEMKNKGYLFTEYDYGEVMDKYHKDEPVLKAMCLHVAHDCNLRCQYCFASTGDFHGDRMLMDAATGKKALDFLVAHSGNRKHLEVDFFGGEPLMNFQVVKEIVAYGRYLETKHDKLFKFTLTSNGLNLRDEVIEYLNQEMENVVVSLDGRPDIHNEMRKTVKGKDSFELIYPMALKLTESRKQRSYYIRGTYTNKNLDFAEDVKALADYGFKEISIEPVVADPSQDYSLSENDLPAIRNEYERLAEIYLDYRNKNKGFHFFHFNIDLSQGPCVIKRLTGCGAGNEYIAVTPEGDIYPCHQFVGKTEFLMGNINGSFDRTMQRMFKDNHVLSKNKCKDCWARFYCSGGCHANAYQFNGNIQDPYELGCEMERKRLECAIALYVKENFNNSDQD